jgi:hypothetical protein
MPQPTFPPISDTVLVDLLYTSNDGVAVVNAQNRLAAHFDTPVSNADIDTLVDDIKASWITNILPLVQTEWALVGMRAKNWNNVLNPVREYSWTPEVGTAAGDPVPFTACAVVRFQTEGTTPSSCYIRHGGLVESQVDGNHLGTVAQAAIAAAWLAVSNDITILGRDHVCVQVYNPGGSGATLYKDAGTVEDVNDASCRRLIGRSASRLT